MSRLLVLSAALLLVCVAFFEVTSSMPTTVEGGVANPLTGNEDHCVELPEDHYCSQFIGRSKTTYFPNPRGHKTYEQANTEFTDFVPLLRSGCHEKLGTLLCFVYFPFCENAYPSVRIYPCSEVCDEITANNSQCTALIKQIADWNNALQCDLNIYLPRSSMRCADGVAPVYSGSPTENSTDSSSTTTEPSDVNECEEGTDDCDTNAQCTNTEGSYTCTCNDGYSGDGKSCTDKDECASGTHNCDKNATCTNTDGGFSCTCNDGYSGDGVACTEDCSNACPTCKYRKNASGKTFKNNGFCYAAKVTVTSMTKPKCKYTHNTLYTLQVDEQFDLLTPYNQSHATKAPSMGNSVQVLSGPESCSSCPKLEKSQSYFIAGLYNKAADGSVTWMLDGSNSLVSVWSNRYSRKVSGWIATSANYNTRAGFIQACEKDSHLVSTEQWSLYNQQ